MWTLHVININMLSLALKVGYCGILFHIALLAFTAELEACNITYYINTVI